jgi:hypothetical protein
MRSRGRASGGAQTAGEQKNTSGGVWASTSAGRALDGQVKSPFPRTSFEATFRKPT